MVKENDSYVSDGEVSRPKSALIPRETPDRNLSFDVTRNTLTDIRLPRSTKLQLNCIVSRYPWKVDNLKKRGEEEEEEEEEGKENETKTRDTNTTREKQMR